MRRQSRDAGVAVVVGGGSRKTMLLNADGYSSGFHTGLPSLLNRFKSHYYSYYDL